MKKRKAYLLLSIIVVILVIGVSLALINLYRKKKEDKPIVQHNDFMYLDTNHEQSIENNYLLFKNYEDFKSKIESDVLTEESFVKNNYVLIRIRFNECSQAEVRPTEYTMDGNTINIKVKYKASCGVCALANSYYLLAINKNMQDVTVNIDQDAQQKLYDLVNDGSVPFTNDKMQVGATIIDPRTGHVIAIIGGRKLPAVQLGLNRAVQTGRSTGSTVKPVLDYGPAIEYLNWPTSHMLDDSKYVYPGTNIQLYDWDNKYEGKITMRRALEQSRNVPAVKTLSKVGVARASLFARKLGVNVPSDSGLSVAIGANASSLQMAGAFGAFANDGIYHKPQFVSKIETPDGLTRNYDSSGTRVMKESTAYIMTDMLKGVMTKGSGTQARIKNLYEAGKTGTVKYSDEELVRYPQYKNSPKDSWFVGYTKLYSMGIWTGYDNLKDGTPSGVGASSAQLLYKQMMSYLMSDKANKAW